MEYDIGDAVGRIWIWVMIGLIWSEARAANERLSTQQPLLLPRRGDLRYRGQLRGQTMF